MAESYIEKKVCKRATDHGWLCRKFASPGQRAVPDRFFAKGGRVILVEFKDTGKKPSKLQLFEHTRFRDHGVEVYVIDNVEDGYALFEE